MVLAGCSTGSVRDAAVEATQSAEETNVVANMEATQVVRQFFDPTPTPSPAPTVLPTLANLQLATSIGEQNRPQDQIYVYRRGGAPLYVAAQIGSLNPGQRVIASWRDSGGNVLHETDVAIENQRELVWIAQRWDVPGSLPGGTYSVFILVEGDGRDNDGKPARVTTEIGSLVFQIS